MSKSERQPCTADRGASHPVPGFATIPLHDPGAAADEMRRCVNELGLVGTLIMGTCGGLFLDDERFDPVLAAAEEVDLPIYVHPELPSAPVSMAYPREIGPQRRISFLGTRFRLACRGWHPRSAAHFVGGIGSSPEPETPQRSLGRVRGGLARPTRRGDRLGHAPGAHSKRVLPRTCVGDAVGHVQPESTAIHFAELGAERIIYSEDFPYIIRDNVSDFLEQAELTDDQRTAIAHPTPRT